MLGGLQGDAWDSASWLVGRRHLWQIACSSEVESPNLRLPRFLPGPLRLETRQGKRVVASSSNKPMMLETKLP